MANIQNRTSAGLPAERFKVHAPRNPGDKDEFARFVSSLNAQLGRVSDTIAAMPSLDKDFDPDEYVKTDEMRDLLDQIDEEDAVSATSEGEEEASNKGKNKKTSRRRKRIEEAAESVIKNAISTTAPPAVADVGSAGTTTNPVLFALSDHTHSGVNLTDPQTITALKTFDRDPGAPFAVTPGSDTVVNLGAERARRAILAMPSQAGVTALIDLGFRRVYMAPRGVGAV